MSEQRPDRPRGRRPAPRSSRASPSDVKAIDVVELDLRGVLGYTDYFVICSGNTDRQTKAIHDRHPPGAEEGARPAAAPRRGPGRGALDPHGLPRRASCTSSRPRRASSTGSSSSGARRPSAPSATRAPERREAAWAASRMVSVRRTASAPSQYGASACGAPRSADGAQQGAIRCGARARSAPFVVGARHRVLTTSSPCRSPSWFVAVGSGHAGIVRDPG